MILIKHGLMHKICTHTHIRFKDQDVMALDWCQKLCFHSVLMDFDQIWICSDKIKSL